MLVLVLLVLLLLGACCGCASSIGALSTNGRRARSCIEARGLEPKDGGADGGTSDPYVKVTCMDKHARTKTVEKELNPIWDQWVVLESVRSASDFPLHFGQLLVTLYDEDFFTGDDEIGSFEIDLAEVWKREGHCVRTRRALRFCDRARLHTCRPSHNHCSCVDPSDLAARRLLWIRCGRHR